MEEKKNISMQIIQIPNSHRRPTETRLRLAWADTDKAHKHRCRPMLGGFRREKRITRSVRDRQAQPLLHTLATKRSVPSFLGDAGQIFDRHSLSPGVGCTLSTPSPLKEGRCCCSPPSKDPPYGMGEAITTTIQRVCLNRNGSKTEKIQLLNSPGAKTTDSIRALHPAVH